MRQQLRAPRGGDGEPCLGVISAQILACPGGLALVDAARTVLGRRKGEAAAQNKANEAMAAIQSATELGQAWHFEECMGDDGAVSSEGCAILMLPTAGMQAFAAAHESFYEAKKVKGHLGDKTSEQLVSAGADSDCIANRFQFDFDSISIRFGRPTVLQVLRRYVLRVRPGDRAAVVAAVRSRGGPRGEAGAVPSPPSPFPPSPLLPPFLLDEAALEVSPVPWDGRAVEEAEKLTRALGNSFGRQIKDPVDQAAACLRRLARLARAALQPFASAEDSEFLCEVCSYDLVGVLPGGPTAQPESEALAKQLQEKVRTRAGQLYDESAMELSSFLSAVLQGRGGKLDIVGSGHKYANRVEKLALLLGKQPACEDVKKVLSVATRAADIVSKGATGALVPQDVALLTAAAEDMAKVNEVAALAVIQWFEDRGGKIDFNKEALEALMAKAQHAAASFQKAKKAENAKAVSELSVVKDARAALETCQAPRHSSSMCLRTESDSMPLRLQLDSASTATRFESDSIPIRLRFDSIPRGARQA